MKNGVLKSDWFTGLAVTFIFLIFAGSDFTTSLERSAYDFGVRSSTSTASDKIAIISIDDQSIANIGRWPWSRDIHAQMHDILASSGAKVIGQTVFFSEPQEDPGLQFVRELKKAFQSSNIAAVPAYVEELAIAIEESQEMVKDKRDLNGQTAISHIAKTLEMSPLRYELTKELDAYLENINSAELILDTDSILAQSIQASGNIVFNMPFVPGQPYGQPDEDLPEYISKNKLNESNIIDNSETNPNGFTPLQVVDAYPPIPILGKQASAIGASASLHDVDGGIRSEPLRSFRYQN